MKRSSSADLNYYHYFFIALIAVSGAAALGHQLLWTRRLTDLLGASAESNVRVFGCFFFGLGLGSALAAWKGTVIRPFRALFWLEVGIAVLTVPILTLPQWTDWIWPALGTDALIGWQGGAVKLVLSFFMITPPAVLMGVGFPIFIRAVLRGDRVMERHGIQFYASNTLGGVVGLLLAAAWLIPWAGATGSMIAFIAMNGALAAAFLLLDRSALAHGEAPKPEDKAHLQEQISKEKDGLSFAFILWLSFFSGAGILAAEVTGLKMLNLVATISFHTPTALLCSVILSLSVSAFCIRYLLSLIGSTAAGVPLFASLAGILLCLAPVIFMAIVTRENPFIGHESLWAFTLQFVWVALLTFGPAMFVGGLLFPSALHWLGAEDRDFKGRRLGWLLALNGIGGLVGAEVAYSLLIPKMGVYRTFGWIGMAYIVLAAVIAFRHSGRWSMVGKIVSVMAGIAGVSLLVGKLGSMPHINTKVGFELMAEKNGREGHLAVIHNNQMGKAILLSNQYILGSENAKYDQERQAHLPIMLHPNPRQVGFIGHATGMTAGAALLHEQVERIVSVEIAQSVIDAATEYFSDLNHSIASNERALLLNEDGRTYFAASEAEFDVIEADLFLPWGPGVGRLYSIEHFRTVQGALRPGGIFCQWLPMYQLTPEQFDLIAHTFQQVFPDTHLFRGTFLNHVPTLALVGFRDSELDWSVVSKNCNTIRQAGAVLDPVIRHREAIAMLYLGKLTARDSKTVNTLNNLRLELDAAEVRLTDNKSRPYLEGAKWLEWMSELDKEFETESDAGLDTRTWSALGFSISKWEALAYQKHPQAKQLRKNILAKMPLSLQFDVHADWKQWPGNIRP